METRLQTAALRKLQQEDLLRSGGFALDLGCGAGRDSIALAQMGYDVDAVDQDPEQLSQLREQSEGLPIKVTERDIAHFTIEKAHYSIILANDSLSFIKNKETVFNIIAEMVDGLNQSGILYFNLFGTRDSQSRNHLMSFFTYDEVIAFLSRLPIKLHYRSTEEGFTKNPQGEDRYYHIHKFTYIRA